MEVGEGHEQDAEALPANNTAEGNFFAAKAAPAVNHGFDRGCGCLVWQSIL